MISFLESYKDSLSYLQLFHLEDIYGVWIYTRYLLDNVEIYVLIFAHRAQFSEKNKEIIPTEW